jgi:hypothetical protein
VRRVPRLSRVGNLLAMPNHRPGTPRGREPHRDRGRLQDIAGWDPMVVEQDQVWVDRYGTNHALVAMSYPYRAAVLRMLLDNAPRIWMQYHAATLHRLVSDVLEHGRVPGDLLAAQFDVVPSHRMEPAEWLESTPLVRTLRRLQRPRERVIRPNA